MSKGGKSSLLKNPRIRLGAKLLLVAGLLYFLAKKGFLSVEATGAALTQWQYTMPAAFALFCGTLTAITRWYWLLRAQGIVIPFRRGFSLSLVGMFFNMALPGAVSGDVVKALYVGREVPGKEARALGSILFDRVVGVSALLLLSACGITWDLLGQREVVGAVRAVQIILMTSAAGVVAFYAYLMLVKDHYDPLLILLKKLESRFPNRRFFGSLKRTQEGIRQYHHHKGLVMGSLLLSLVNHALIMTATYLVAQAMGETQIPMVAFYILAPLGYLVTAIPVMPGGVGTGHAAFLALFHLVGSERGADIFSVVLLFRVLEAAVGGLVYLKFKTKAPLPPVADHLHS